MLKHVAFLRGMNVGGHRVKMDWLRVRFVEMGFSDVATHLASGNVIFSAPDAHAGALETMVEQRLAEALGYDVPTFLRTTAELAEVVSQAHRAAAGGFQGDECSTYVTFLKAPLEETEVSALRALESDTDRFVVAERELYWLLAGKLSASPLFKGNDVTRALKGVEHTQRNLSSLEKLLAKHGPGA